MRRVKITVTIDKELLTRLDRLVGEEFPSRSRAIEDAVRDKLQRLDCGRLARECAKLDTTFEQQLADLEFAEDYHELADY